MGTLRKRGDSWRAEVFKRGVRESGTFDTRQEAVDWIVQREAAINVDTGPRARHTFGHAVSKRLATEGLSRFDLLRLQAFPAQWAGMDILEVTPAVIADWRDMRLKEVKPGTVLRELTVLRSLFAVARAEWQWVKVNPVADVKKPKSPEPRKRVIADDERDAMLDALGFDGAHVETIADETAIAFLLTLETGMRAGEILALSPDQVKRNVAAVAKSKTGPGREVPLSKRAVELFDILKKKRLLNIRDAGTGRLFHVSSKSLDVTFRRARAKAALSGFTFHDGRATAITRLSKILDPLELARMVGHSDLRSLMVYFRESASSIAARLD